MLVDGNAAAALGELARERLQRAAGKTVDAASDDRNNDP